MYCKKVFVNLTFYHQLFQHLSFATEMSQKKIQTFFDILKNRMRRDPLCEVFSFIIWKALLAST